MGLLIRSLMITSVSQFFLYIEISLDEIGSLFRWVEEDLGDIHGKFSSASQTHKGFGKLCGYVDHQAPFLGQSQIPLGGFGDGGFLSKSKMATTSLSLTTVSLSQMKIHGIPLFLGFLVSRPFSWRKEPFSESPGYAGHSR